MKTMMNNQYNLTYIRWTARIFAAVLLFQIIAYAYCIVTDASTLVSGLRALLRFSNGAAFLAVVLAGVLIAWKREGLGGALITTGVLGFYLSCYLMGATIMGISFILWPGILFMLYGLATRRHRRLT